MPWRPRREVRAPRRPRKGRRVTLPPNTGVHPAAQRIRRAGSVRYEVCCAGGARRTATSSCPHGSPHDRRVAPQRARLPGVPPIRLEFMRASAATGIENRRRLHVPARRKSHLPVSCPGLYDARATARKRRRVTAEGPYGNGRAKANACAKDNDCCTSLYKQAKGRRRCKKLGQGCRDDRSSHATVGWPTVHSPEDLIFLVLQQHLASPGFKPWQIESLTTQTRAISQGRNTPLVGQFPTSFAGVLACDLTRALDHNVRAGSEFGAGWDPRLVAPAPLRGSIPPTSGTVVQPWTMRATIGTNAAPPVPPPPSRPWMPFAVVDPFASLPAVHCRSTTDTVSSMGIGGVVRCS